MASEIVFWTATGLIALTYVGYPAAIALLAAVRPRPVQRASVRPRVTLLVVAFNEASTLPRKLENCLGLDYPPDLLDIVVASDGSTDGTDEIAAGFARRGITGVAFPRRRGKPSVLNDVIPRCRGDVVVLSDARQLYEPGAVMALVENFADPTVGAASGELRLRESAGASAVGHGVGIYWRYEKLIRECESRFDSSVGATGAIYAIRRRLFEPIPPDTLVDDVLIPLRIARQGHRVIFEARARAFDRVAQAPGQEFARKVRTIAGTLRLFADERWLWNPRQNRLWLQTLCHKLLRVAGPLLLAAAFAASAALAVSGGWYALALAGQVAFYGAALLGARRGAPGRWWVSAPYAFCLLNAAALVGIARFVAGTQAVTWRTTGDLESPRPPIFSSRCRSGKASAGL
jgi:cellulose synthase/poly-beta-1,6-N-acetylglucosamine synthase-like glycosyltransferase